MRRSPNKSNALDGWTYRLGGDAGPVPCLCIVELSIDFCLWKSAGDGRGGCVDRPFVLHPRTGPCNFAIWFRNTIVADIWTLHELINTVVQ